MQAKSSILIKERGGICPAASEIAKQRPHRLCPLSHILSRGEKSGGMDKSENGNTLF
jgi:hypothetical protein